MNWGENKNCKPDFDDQPSQEHNSARLIQQLPNKPTAGNIKTMFLFSAEYQVLIYNFACIIIRMHVIILKF